jgi:UDP-N-acetylglucosamine acyltransferase
MSIHPHALVSSEARIGQNVKVGPYSIIEGNVVVGDGCIIESGVVIKNGTTLGSNNHIFEGAVIGQLPQHARPPEHLGDLVIGSNNIIREHVTIHRALHAGGTTSLGDNNMIMVGVHIAHDCHVGNSTIFANNVLLAGHVTVGDRAFISGAVGVHQFCRIGGLAMVGGHARLVQDVPPYVTVDGASSLIVGLNLVGLRRNGFTAEEISELKAAYRTIYRSGLVWRDVVAELKVQYPSGPAAMFHDFLAQGSRGFVQERRTPPTATLKLRRDDEEETLKMTPATEETYRERRAKAG